MSQMTFSDYEYSLRKRKTKREEFLDIMNEIIPWEEWVEFVRPYYPNGKRGRPTKGIEKMLRMYLLQIWFNLSDEGVEDAIYDSYGQHRTKSVWRLCTPSACKFPVIFVSSDEKFDDASVAQSLCGIAYAFRKFMNIDFMEEQVPDATTLLKFRHLLEENHLGEEFFKAINRVMEATGHIMHGGTIVDATIISAPSSTKNAEKKRDPEMHQTKKGNEWKFGMKCHIGVDSGSGLMHTVTVMPAKVHDITEAHKLLREDDAVAYGDSGYIGIEKRDEIKNNVHFNKIDFRINRRPKSLPQVSDHTIDWEARPLVGFLLL